MQPLFEIKHLAIHDLCYNNLLIYKNNVTFITGLSGCGKSTLLRVLNRTLEPKSCEIYYNGQSFDSFPLLEYRKDVLLVSQDIFLFDGTIQENFYLFHEHIHDQKIETQKIIKYLEICNLTLGLETHTSYMSGGEKQRLFLAIHLSFSPNVLLLDEPSSALDHHTSTIVLKNIIDYTKSNNIDLVIVSHNADLTKEFAESNIKLKKGAK